MLTKKKIRKTVDKIHKELNLSFPVNLRSVCENFGLTIEYVPIEDVVSGMIAYCDQNSGIIAVNNEHVETRQRFTIAHEIGHFFLHKNSFIDKHYRKTSNEDLPQSVPEEVQANFFAAELLMPQFEIERLLQEWDLWQFDNKDIIMLAEHFNVSVVAMTVRLKSLGYVPDWAMV